MKILQWNIWYQEDVKNILELLKKVDADIVCLQELTVNHRRHNIDTAKYIADGLKYNFFYKEAQIDISSDRIRSYGNGIFSRYTIINSNFKFIRDLRAPETGMIDYSREGRVYIESLIDTGDRKLAVATTHMSYTDRFAQTPDKTIETDKLIAILKEKRDNYVLTGDFNSVPGSYTINEIEKRLKNAGPDMNEKTWTTKPFSYKGFAVNTLDWRLDYCFVTPDIKIKSAEIIKTDFSDHLPILLEV